MCAMSSIRRSISSPCVAPKHASVVRLMEEVLARLPPKLQLDWCLRGFGDVPWFLPGPSPDELGVVDTRPIRIIAEAPIEAVEGVDPVALTMLAAWLIKRKNDGASTQLDESAKSVNASRSGLLRVLAGKVSASAQTLMTPGGDTLLFPTHLAKETQIEPILKQLGGMFRLDKESTEALKYCFSELLRNVFEHSLSPYGGVIAAAHYPKSERLTVALADLGISVPVHIRRKHGAALDDEKALRAALEPRATGSFDLRRNAGLGLYMTRRLADMVGGKFWMLTGSLCARHDGDESPGGRATIDISPVANPWRGTVVALTLRPGAISSFDLTLRRANEELRGGLFKSDIRFSKTTEHTGMDVIEVSADAGNMAQDKIGAATIRQTQILPALRAGKSLILSFRGVALTTQSFIHALLAEPLSELGVNAGLERLIYARCSDQVREVIRLVVGYVLEAAEMREDAPAGNSQSDAPTGSTEG